MTIFNCIAPGSRYIAQLVFEKKDDVHSSKETYLNIVETNSFKHIIHLSLKFAQASEEQLKRHLGDLNKSYRASALLCMLGSLSTWLIPCDNLG